MSSIISVEDFIEKHSDRKDELTLLRELLLSLPLEESVKWGMPAYTYDKGNIVGIGSFKNWSCLYFHKGCLLSDKSNVFHNVSQEEAKGMRQWRFLSHKEIDRDLVTEYLKEAIANEKLGRKVKNNRASTSLVDIPELLNSHLSLNQKHLRFFESLTVTQRNNFSNYISDAKRPKTKLDRLDKVKRLLENNQKLNS